MAGRFDSNRLCSIRYDPIGYTDADSIRCPLSDSSRFELVPILGVKHLAPVVIASLVKTEKPKHNRQQDQTLDKTTSNKIKNTNTRTSNTTTPKHNGGSPTHPLKRGGSSTPPRRAALTWRRGFQQSARLFVLCLALACSCIFYLMFASVL